MRLTCHDCGSTIYISTEAPNCPECGTELESYLRGLDYVRECYQQASEETLAGDDERALAILAQGLSAVNASELHLLAALIHRKQGEYDGMRRHVAAIPVDDPLRPEGEWLLRSHQQKQRDVRQAQKEYHPSGHAGKAVRQLSPEFYSVPPELESPLRPRRRLSRRILPTITLLLVLIVGALLLRDPLLQGLAQWMDQATPVAVVQPLPTQFVNTPAQSNVAAVVPTSPPTPVPATATSEPTPAPTPLPSPTPPLPVAAELPLEETAAAGEPQPIASVGDVLAVAVATADSNRFDLASYLTQAGRADLAALEINALLQDGRFTLAGAVPYTSHRLELIALAGEVPGVAEVDAIDLVVRLPDTYTVTDGDTLWTIAYYLFGDGSRWEEVYEANADLLGNSTLLDVGMELQVPVQ